MKKLTRFKDLPLTQSLTGVRFIHPHTKAKVYFYSSWAKGIWFKTDMASSQIFPLFVRDMSEAMDFIVCKDKGLA